MKETRARPALSPRRLPALCLVAWLAGLGCALGGGTAPASAAGACRGVRDTPAARQAVSAVGTQPELVLRDLAGVEQKLSSLRGRVVVLNFWATYCEPCRKEMPELSAIQKEYAALGVQVIGASADGIGDRAKVLQFIKETKINFPVWTGMTAALISRFGLAPVMPGTVVLDRDGRVVSASNAVVNPAELRKQLDALTAAPPKGTGAHSDAKGQARRSRRTGRAGRVRATARRSENGKSESPIF